MVGPYRDDPNFLAWESLGDWAKRDPANWPVHHVLYRFAQMRHAKLTVEIGIGRGMGTYFLGAHAKMVGGKHYAIDVALTPIKRASRRRRWGVATRPAGGGPRSVEHR